MMDVSVLTATDTPECLIYWAARQCYGGALTVDEFEPSDCGLLIGRLLKDGHLSPFEHTSITYQVNGISRACSHQLVRHRLASYTQQSQRYVMLDKKPEWVIPPSIEASEDAKQTFLNRLHLDWSGYKDLVKDNEIPVEDARYMLPNATPTNIVVTMNFRELLHFFELRCCKRAQWEIRELANKMLELAREIAPNVFKDAGPKCATCEQECPDE